MDRRKNIGDIDGVRQVDAKFNMMLVSHHVQAINTLAGEGFQGGRLPGQMNLNMTQAVLSRIAHQLFRSDIVDIETVFSGMIGGHCIIVSVGDWCLFMFSEDQVKIT